MKKITYTKEQTESELDWLSQAQTLLGENQFRRNPLSIDRSEIPILKNHHRLGVHFEDLFEFHIKSCTQISDLYSHIQIIEDKKTLGEADFLVRRNDVWQHIEIAIKFYLRVGKTGQLSDFLGPSLTDSLDRKVNHIENRQLKLLQSDAAKSTLQTLGVGSPVNSFAQIFGWLFYHVTDDQSNIPKTINPHHARGRWLAVNELPSFIGVYPDTVRFLIPSRSEWLIAPSQINGVSLSKRDLLTRVSNLIDRPQQLFVVLGEGRSKQMLERIFVVPEAWLAKAKTLEKQA